MGSELIQGTDSWREMRRGYLGASDAPVIMGVSPWSTPYKLFEDKMGMAEEVSNYAMGLGNDLEPVARGMFEKEFNLTMEPKVIYHPDKSFMMCSLDGLSDDGATAVEIKYAGKDKHNMAKDGQIPECYYPQLQHQLACTGLDSIWYCSFDGEEIVNVQVYRDDSYIEKMIAKEEDFWKCVQTFTPPELTNKDFVEKDSSIWLDHANRLREIDMLLKSLTSEKELIRKDLIEDASGQSSKGFGISLSKTFSNGRVDYKKIPELKGVDLDKYRSNPKESWRLNLLKS